MDIFIILLSLAFLMLVAYRGFSVILFAPVAAMLAVAFTNPNLVPVFFSGIFMEKLAGFVKLYFPVFLLGAIFGKLIEISGFARSIAYFIVRLIGEKRAMLTIVLICALLTYGGVSLFVVAFAIYPFAVELFRLADIPKRLIPATIALGAFTFTMDALPGTPQIQNIIPTTFFNTTTWAAPWLGLIGSVLVFTCGMFYLGWRRKVAAKKGQGYASAVHSGDRPGLLIQTGDGEGILAPVAVAFLPLLLVGVCNKLFTLMILNLYESRFDFAAIGLVDIPPLDVPKLAAVWAVSGALIVGITAVIFSSFKTIRSSFRKGTQESIGGAMLATLNTASEYGYGSVIAALPGFKQINQGLAHAISDPLVNEAVTTTTLAGVTGSASGGMSIALAAMSDTYIEQAAQHGIPNEVLHRVASMASGGMDTLPHNGAVITLLAITGLTHRESYVDIFAMTIIKTVVVFLIIGLYYLTGIV